MAGGHVRKITEIKKLETLECAYIDTFHFILCCHKTKKELILVCSVADLWCVCCGWLLYTVVWGFV